MHDKRGLQKSLHVDIYRDRLISSVSTGILLEDYVSFPTLNVHFLILVVVCFCFVFYWEVTGSNTQTNPPSGLELPDISHTANKQQST